ncbi:hypothetical protein VNO78_03376 [Psophocarpus tetragonolobus]|uniref:cytokinin dehydrogenase n=1 Tax=Psophocarpus tetragonolobus TaxID=3891 RepID=A0AAN9XWL9_PSOTE
MANNIAFCIAMAFIVLCSTVSTQAQYNLPEELAKKLNRNNETLSIASTDYGNIFHQTPWAVLEPSLVSDISSLINYSNSLSTPFTIAQRGQAHSTKGQANAPHGVVVNMTNFKRYGSRISVPHCDVNSETGCYADVGSEQVWIDLLRKTLEYGLTPLAWTDYINLSIGGTLSNAGISGQAFRHGPQISNVLEMDVITGKGDFVTCSKKKNSEIYYAVLGGLGQFGVITRARIVLGPAPTMANQEYLVSYSKRNETIIADFVQGMIILNHPPVDLSFYQESDQQRINSLITQNDLIYYVEIVKYYDNTTQAHIKEDVEYLVKGLNYIPTFRFERDNTYEEFMNRYGGIRALDRSPSASNPWLDMLVPSSRILDINEGVYKNIILKNNITGSTYLCFPVNRNK